MKKLLDQKPQQHSLQNLCIALQVSRAGYYSLNKRKSIVADQLAARPAIEAAAI